MTNTNIGKILEMTSQGVGKWRKEKRPIISLLEKYFTKEDLEEFIEAEKIEKQDLIKNLTVDEVKNLIKNEHNAKILAQIEDLKKQLV